MMGKFTMFEIETVEIMGGNFEMGSSFEEINDYISLFSYAFNDFPKTQVQSWFLKQIPKIKTSVTSFHLGIHQITNIQYLEFEQAVFGKNSISNIENPMCPVEGVTFCNALAFCEWMSKVSNHIYRLPTEVEWEFAASSRGQYIWAHLGVGGGGRRLKITPLGKQVIKATIDPGQT